MEGLGTDINTLVENNPSSFCKSNRKRVNKLEHQKKETEDIKMLKTECQRVDDEMERLKDKY